MSYRKLFFRLQPLITNRANPQQNADGRRATFTRTSSRWQLCQSYSNKFQSTTVVLSNSHLMTLTSFTFCMLYFWGWRGPENQQYIGTLTFNMTQRTHTVACKSIQAPWTFQHWTFPHFVMLWPQRYTLVEFYYERPTQSATQVWSWKNINDLFIYYFF